MYQQSRRRGPNPLLIIGALALVGVVVGVGFFFMQSSGSDDEGDTNAAVVLPAPGGGSVPNPVVSLSPEDLDALFYPSLRIPSLGVDTVIVSAALEADGWDVRVLGERVGHLQYTGWLTNGGNIVLAGHVEMADGSAGIFSRIEQLGNGDRVTIVDNQVEYNYRVTDVRRVNAQDMSVVYNNGIDQVTLITCTDYDFFAGDYGERIVVTAELEG